MDNDSTLATDALVEERKLFKRLVIASNDLAHAAQFAQAILKRGLHSLTEEPDRYLLAGMTTALVVAYWRSFTSNRGTAEAVKSLPEASLGEFTDEEKQLHQRVGNLRNTAFAHSDAGVMRVRVSIRQFNEVRFAIPSHWDPHRSLTKADVVTLSTIIEKLRRYILQEHLRIQALLPVDDRF